MYVYIAFSEFEFLLSVTKVLYYQFECKLG